MIKSTKSNFWGTVANLILRNRLLILITISVMTLFLASQWQHMRLRLLSKSSPRKIFSMKILSRLLEGGNLIVTLKDDYFFTKEIK